MTIETLIAWLTRLIHQLKHALTHVDAMLVELLEFVQVEANRLNDPCVVGG